ncbi:DUF2213 domain-containing protein [Roseomonas mucosa]|uniref:DUF2213 domain-containing protein n=1 Tax=Roseomonas mucosa TaxID=207340 RepID=UPI002244FF5A|nr:DUF2213 domain-containing protein [Roseomonas mucosa]UZO91757.1 Hypothetical protein RMP42_06002 [Roseomonas mucosa]
MLITDAAKVATVERTADGYLVASVLVSRSGIQTYRGSEMGKPELDVVSVYRPEDEVFSRKALASYSNRPVTLGHPSGGVNSRTWRDTSVGHLDAEVVREGEFVRAQMMVSDEAAIEAIEAGTREISMGYTCSIDFEDGVTPDGQPYQAVQRAMRMNHAAIVPRGRAGSQCRIGDSWDDAPITRKEPAAMAEPNRAVVVDGITHNLSDLAAQIVERLQKQMSDAQAAHVTALDAQSAKVDAMQAKVDAKDAEIARLTALTTDSALDSRVAERSEIVTKVKAILGDTFDVTGKSNLELKRAAVAKARPKADLAGKGDAYFDAAFDLIEDEAPRNDALAAVLRDRAAHGGMPVITSDAAYEEMRQRNANAWKDAK